MAYAELLTAIAMLLTIEKLTTSVVAVRMCWEAAWTINSRQVRFLPANRSLVFAGGTGGNKKRFGRSCKTWVRRCRMCKGRQIVSIAAEAAYQKNSKIP